MSTDIINRADCEAAFTKAKIQLMAKPDTAFYSAIVFSLKFRWDTTLNPPTAATDGTHLWMHPEFFMKLSPENRIGLLCHEAMHVAYDHMGRCDGRDKRKFNIAADHVINLQLKERGFNIGDLGMCDPQYTGMGAEEVYGLLPDPPPQDCSGTGQGQGQGIGNDLRDPGASGISKEAHDKHIGDVLIRAQMQSKQHGDKPGTIPGDIEIFINRLLDPVLPWNRILQKYLQKFSRSDWSFKKPSRRFFPRYHMPSLIGQNALIDLAIAVDTSGSVSDHDFNVMVSEIYTILRMMKPENIDLIQFDCDIKSVTRIKDVRGLMSCKFTGRGGTNVSPVYQWANENKPSVLLIFTDGGFHVYEYDPTCPVIWLIHNNDQFTSHIGKVVHYKI